MWGLLEVRNKDLGQQKGIKPQGTTCLPQLFNVKNQQYIIKMAKTYLKKKKKLIWPYIARHKIILKMQETASLKSKLLQNSKTKSLILKFSWELISLNSQQETFAFYFMSIWC